MKGFIDFIREQGVVGLAVGFISEAKADETNLFILGGAVSKVVTALVTDIVNPLLGLVLGFTGEFKNASLNIGSAKILYGDMISVVIDFIVVAFVVYYGVKLIGIHRLDKKKS